MRKCQRTANNHSQISGCLLFLAPSVSASPWDMVGSHYVRQFEQKNWCGNKVVNSPRTPGGLANYFPFLTIPSYHNHMIDKLLRRVERYITTLVKKKRGGGLNMWCLLSNHRTTISLVKRLRCIFRQESHDLQVYILNNPDNKNITMQKYLLMMLFVLGLHLVSLGASFLAWCCIIQVV